MKLVADLHIHSHFSRATSKDLTFEHLSRWAQLKGVHVVGTGDIAHPGWLHEMRAKLEPAEEGLFQLKDEHAGAVQATVPAACQAPVRFMLAGEISNIYKKNGATRKIHHVIFAPHLDAVERIQARLEKIGNIRADGRPILGLDSRNLLEIVLEVDPACHLIPAHIWTPWFALLGSKSGFDSVEECFDDLSPHIFALETGLSSDPPMNWRVSSLDRYTLVSNSDAHSPQKLAREATLFDTELSYPALFQALQTGDPAAFGGTVEFFPEEGKYHLDGHRKCSICWDPKTTLAHGGICPVCGKEVTVGVMHRVELLADRPQGGRPPRTHPFHSLIPLPEVLGQVYGVGAGAKQVEQEYQKLLSRLGSELAILRDLPLAEIGRAGGERLAEGIGRMRRGEVVADAGYDGEYGVIRLFAGTEAPAGQMSLFGEGEGTTTNGGTTNGERRDGGTTNGETTNGERRDGERTNEETKDEETRDEATRGEGADWQQRDVVGEAETGGRHALREGSGPRFTFHVSRSPLLDPLNGQQRAAVLTVDAPLVIVAGPGTGKTRTLTVRIAYLVRELGVAPEAVLAITFTNKAAGEMAERLAGLLGDDVAGRVTIKTFHAFGALLLREHAGRLGLSPQFAILSDDDRHVLLKQAQPGLKQQEIDQALGQISAAKNRLLSPDSPHLSAEFPEFPQLPSRFLSYEAALRASQSLDFDDLVVQAVRLLEASPDVLDAMQQRFRWISVDEYQDVNLAQYRLLRLLAGGGGNLCVIGDPDQAIYGFRGADRSYFLSFQQDYAGAKVLSLSQNYRSTQLILDAAMQVIGRGGEDGASPLRAAELLADFAEQVRLEVHPAPTDRAEAEVVVHQIEQLVGGTSYFSLDSGRVEGAEQVVARSFADFAVLYRLGAQSRLLVEAFDRSGIPYQTIGQTPLYAHKPVRAILAFLWLLHTPQSRVHLEAVLEASGVALPEGAQRDLWELRGTQGNSVGEALKWAEQALEETGRAGAALQERQKRLAALADFWPQLEWSWEAGAAVARLVEQVHGFVVGQRDVTDAAAERPVHQLVLRATPFGSDLAAFIESTTLQSETDAYDPRADRVALMTLHAAKGLEFPVVFIVGCEERLLPYERPGRPVDVDEERRLFYVGMTRAQRKLVLLHARTRFLFGQRMENPPSRFVGDIEAVLKEVREMQRRKAEKPKPDGTQLALF